MLLNTNHHGRGHGHAANVNGNVNGNAIHEVDARGHVPLHYAVTSAGSVEVVQMLLGADPGGSHQYLARCQVLPWKCSALYRFLQTLPSASYRDDHDLSQSQSSNSNSNTHSNQKVNAVAVAMIRLIQESLPDRIVALMENENSLADTPLLLLYRRWSRHRYEAEKFFPGDNSRDEVVQHRRLH